MTWETGKSLLDYGIRRANELEVELNDDFSEDFKDYLNLAYWDVLGEFPWLWAMKFPPYQLTTAPVYQVNATTALGSPVVMLGADPGPVVGYKLLVEDDGFPIRVESQAGGDLTLSTGYVKDNSGAPARLYKDEYVMPGDILTPIRLRRVVSGGDMQLVTGDFFEHSLGKNASAGRPKVALFLTDTVMQIGPWPESIELLEFMYVYRPPALDFSGAAATDTPIMPINIRWIIADRALFYLLTDMEDAKAAMILSNSSIRLGQEKDRQAAFWRTQFWIPPQHRMARSRL